MFGWTCCICNRDFKKGYKSKAIERFKKVDISSKKIFQIIKENSFFSVGISTVKELKNKYFTSVFIINERAIQSLTKKSQILY